MSVYNVEDLIPHRSRMNLIDEIISVDERKAVTASTIRESWPTVKEGSAHCIILVELVAQTAAVCLGWIERQKTEGASDGIGWIVGIKEAVFHCSKFPINSHIITTSEKVFQMEIYSEIAGISKMGHESLAEIKLQVLQSDSNS